MSRFDVHIAQSGSAYVHFDSVTNPCYGIQIIAHSGTARTRATEFHGSNYFPDLGSAKASGSADSKYWAPLDDLSGSFTELTGSGSPCSREIIFGNFGMRYLRMTLKVDAATVFTISDTQKKSS